MDKLPIINLFHILFVAPLLFYVGYMHNYGVTKPPEAVYNLLIILAIVVFLYHLHRAYLVMS